MSSLFADNWWQKHPQDLVFALLVNELNLNPKKIEFIEQFYPNDFWFALEDNFEKLNRSGQKWLEKWDKTNKTLLAQKLDKIDEIMQSEEVKILLYTNSKYPKKLFRLPDYPLILFYKGDLKALERLDEMLTVVGSRLYTKYSEIIMNKILKSACQKGVGVVSGLALGIDGISHQIAVENGALTVGVIGGGLDQKSFYPKQNWKLAQQIMENGGLIMSEYLPGMEPNKFTFPTRNRILASLTNLTWVVQAGLKSGTLITANLAREIGSDLATTPASIFETSTEGNIKLLKEGVNIITESQDIFDLLGLKIGSETEQKEQKIVLEDKIQQQVFDNLSLKPLEIDKLSEKLDLDLLEINSALTMLELNGLVENLGENTWIKRV